MRNIQGTPRMVPEPTVMKLAGMLVGLIWIPLTITASRPRMAYRVPNVTTRLGTPAMVTIAPFMTPQAAPTRAPTTKPSTTGKWGTLANTSPTA